jgi:hypothetical protein
MLSTGTDSHSFLPINQSTNLPKSLDVLLTTGLLVVQAHGFGVIGALVVLARLNLSKVAFG